MPQKARFCAFYPLGAHALSVGSRLTEHNFVVWTHFERSDSLCNSVFVRNVSQCRRGAACSFAHTREEANRRYGTMWAAGAVPASACLGLLARARQVQTKLLSLEEEQHQEGAMTQSFFTRTFVWICKRQASHGAQLWSRSLICHSILCLQEIQNFVVPDRCAA